MVVRVRGTFSESLKEVRAQKLLNCHCAGLGIWWPKTGFIMIVLKDIMVNNYSTMV